MAKSPSHLRFDVHPLVVFQLGDELITDEVQAVIEFVKNCYDAGASYAKVEVNTRARCGDVYPESKFPDGQGYVAITDDGDGMDLDALQRGWLVVSNSEKRQIKATGKGGRRGRFPLGDKGLGRLGSQRLGTNVEVFTTAKGKADEQHIGFSWAAFRAHEALSNVPILGPFTRKSTRKSGSLVLISDLSQPDLWERTDAKEYFEQRLAELISPFRDIEKFTVFVTINGVRLDLVQVTRQLRAEADLTFAFEFDGDLFRITGRTKLRALKPSGRRADIFTACCERDAGRELFDFLKGQKRASACRLRQSRSSAWFAEFESTCALVDLDGVWPLPGDGKPANPGPFRGEIDGFSLDPTRAKMQEAFSSAQEYRAYVKHIAGIYVYRDGFGVRVGKDFLNLGRDWTSGGSWYGLKPANSIGYIAIGARENPNLIETTDREGFKDTLHFRNLRLLLRHFVRSAADAMEFLRRGTIDFCDQQLRETARVPVDLSPEHLAEQIGEELRGTAALSDRVEGASSSLEQSAKRITTAARSVKSSLFSSTTEYQAAQESLRDIEASVEQGKAALSEARDSLSKVEDLQRRYDVLMTHIERFQDRLAQAYETMAVGLTAEALVHEIRQVTDKLAQRTSAIQTYVKSNEFTDTKITAYFRHVQSSVAALRKQLSHLDPALRYVREQREALELRVFLDDWMAYHLARWKGQRLKLRVESRDDNTFHVNVNRGKLTQVFDNLVLNAEHWLKEDLRTKRIEAGEVSLEVRAPYVWFSDNGRGIDPSVEVSLFEPFVTLKQGGRGLGLFVVEELLKSEGCTIGLSPERNSDNRLYKFELDLAGMIHDQEDG